MEADPNDSHTRLQALDEWGVFLVQEREDVWGFKRRESEQTELLSSRKHP